jgi:hypothetical protein
MYKYLKLNELFRKWILIIIVLGLICSIPSIWVRHQSEQSSKTVEFAFDYRDLVEISNKYTYPQKYLDDQLKIIKNLGVSSLIAYESSLNEMKNSRYIRLFSSDDLYLGNTDQKNKNENFTYLTFMNQEIQNSLQPFIESHFAQLGIQTRPWTFNGESGLAIETNMNEAASLPLAPNPVILEKIKALGFQTIIRLSNRRNFDETEMDQWLNTFQKSGVKRIIIDGVEAPGYSNEFGNENLDIFAKLLMKHEIGLVTIELSNIEQRGLKYLAGKINYNVVRLHSFTERDNDKIADLLKRKDEKSMISLMSSRFALAVKDRNIKIVMLNAQSYENRDTKEIINTLPVIYKSLEGKDGAIEKVKKMGFRIGNSKEFPHTENSNWLNALRILSLIGAVAFIAYTFSFFMPRASLLLFLIGLLGIFILHQVSLNLYTIHLSLSVAISAPTLALFLTIRTLQSQNFTTIKSKLLFTIIQLLKATMISLCGVIFLISFLNHVRYLLVLEQFRGVTLLHIVPIVLVMIYLILFSESNARSNKWETLKKYLTSPVNLLLLIGMISSLFILNYYLSRTGNSGEASSTETIYRSLLENTLGTRPRTKEFLISHPIFIFSVYLLFKYKHAIYLALIGVIGQLSIVNTFTHLHTPIEISLTRVIHGLWIGTLLGIIFIFIWEIMTWGWNKWGKTLN